MFGFEPQKRNESAKPKAVKNGTHIAPKKEPSKQAQALNQAPDSIPSMYKPGEYVLPADTVDAVGGVQALDKVVQATHTPAPKTAVVPQGFEPKLFFTDGGNAQQAYDKWQDAKTPWYRQSTPTSVANERAAEQAYTDLVRNPQSKIAFGGNPGAVAPAAAVAPAPATATSTDADGQSAQAKESVSQQQAASQVTTPESSPSQPAAPEAQVFSKGVFKHGEGQYSDSAAGMGFTPGFTGQPNAQNLQAASNLAAQSAPVEPGTYAQRIGQPLVGGFRAPTVAHSGNDWTSREMMRRAKMDATSLKHQSHWAPKGSAKAAQDNYARAQHADLAAQAQQGTMDMQAMGFNAELGREQMRQDGAMQRALVGQAGDAARLGLEERRLAGEEAARGYKVRQGQRLENAQNAYLSAKTPEEKASALSTMRVLSGEGDGQLKDNFMSLGGGQEWDAQANTMRNVPQRLIDLRTGQEVGGNQTSQAKPLPDKQADLQVGEVYQTARGLAKWDGKQMVTVN